MDSRLLALRTRASGVLLATALFAIGSPAVAQDRPADWLDRPDDADADMSGVTFVSMTPGWHITSGPAAIYYPSASTASGHFSVESEIFLFDPDGRREAFGIFVGGADLQGEGQRYVYFLIRPTGEFLIKERNGEETSVLVEWTAHDAIVPWSAKGPDDETVANVLSVMAGGETVSFMVNGTEVVSLPRADVRPDGIVGLRVNHAVNVHVSSLDVSAMH